MIFNIDFNGLVDGEPFTGGEASEFDLDIGSGMLIDGFETGLIGKARGDAVSLDLGFPEQYRNEQLAGKPVTFEIKVNKVLQSRLPELDTAFFEKFGVKQGGSEEFRGEVLKNMERERDEIIARQFKQQVLDRIAEVNPIESPQALIDAESARLLQETRQTMIMQGIPPENVESLTLDSVSEQAQRRVQLGLIMAETIKQAELAVDPGKVRAAVEKIAAGYEDPEQVLRWYYEDQSRLSEIESMCLEDDAIQWVADRARIKEEKVTFDALMNKRQTGEEGKANG